MDVFEAIHSRRSVRAYTVQAVDRGLITELIWDAVQAPPPFARETPWTFNVILGAAHIARLGVQAKQYASVLQAEGGGQAWTERAEFKAFWNAPALVIISGPLADCCRAGQLLVLSGHARGLGSCWVGAPMPWLRTDEGKAAAGIPLDLTPGSAICIGYAAGPCARVERAQPRIIWGGSEDAA